MMRGQRFTTAGTGYRYIIDMMKSSTKIKYYNRIRNKIADKEIKINNHQFKAMTEQQFYDDYLKTSADAKSPPYTVSTPDNGSYDCMSARCAAAFEFLVELGNWYMSAPPRDESWFNGRTITLDNRAELQAHAQSCLRMGGNNQYSDLQNKSESLQVL